MRRCLLPFAAALFALSLAPSAAAAPKHKIALRLAYERPEPVDECPDAEQLGLMIAAEFGYVVVRTDASALLTVQVRREGDRFRADLRAPHPSRVGEEWRRTADSQGTCLELAYDIATLVKLGLGPMKWEGEEPPPYLAAPPDIEVGHPDLRPHVLPSFQSFAHLTPEARAAALDSTQPPEPLSYSVEVGLYPLFSPYGLSSAAVGGGGMFAIRWPRFAVGAELRGLLTPAEGIGEPPAPGRTSIFSGVLFPCVSASFVDFCAAATIGRLDFDLPSNIRIAQTNGFIAGFGGRVAGRWKFASRFILMGHAEVTGEIRHLVLRAAEETGGPGYYWRSPSVRVILGLGIGMTIF